MLTIKKLSLTIFTSLLFACSSSMPVTKSEKTTKEQTEIANKKPEPTITEDLPHWFKKPQLDNHISVIGSAGQQRWGGEQAQYLAAMEDAQRLLEAEFKNKNSSVIDKNLEEKIKKLLLHKAIVKDEWSDPKTGQLYLWLVLPNSTVD